MIVVGVGSKARQGKDTFAGAIVDYYALLADRQRKHAPKVTAPTVKVFKFADALYAEVNAWLATTEGKRFRGLGGILLNKHYTVEEGENFQELHTPAGIYLGTKWDKEPVIVADWVQPEPNPEVSVIAPYGKHPKLLQWWGSEYRRAQDVDYWVKKLVASIQASKVDIALVTDMRFPNEASAIRGLGGATVEVQRLNGDGTQFIDPSRPADHISETALNGYNFDFYIKSKSAALTAEYAITLMEYIRGLESK